jgi:hypothetical protein
MEPRRVRPIPKSELPRLSTDRLLAYRKRLLSLEDSAESSDWDSDELSGLEPGFIRFKDEAEWIELYEEVIAILSSREHSSKDT